MRRLFAFILLWLLAPATANAQGVPPMRGPLGPSQTQTGSRGITVTGSASTRIPATSARIALTIVSSDRSMSLDTQRLQPIVDALVKAGIDPNNIHLPPNFAAPGGSNFATITATVEHPTVEQMQSGIVTVGTVIASLKGMSLASAAVQLTAAGCESRLDAVRDDAVKHARAKAESLAKDLGVQIGGAVNATSFDQLAADGSCSSTYNISGGFNPEGPQSPGDYVSVSVMANVTITFAIK